MISKKRLRSVVQSTAHHAVSGLSYVNLQLRKACVKEGKSFCEIDLLSENPCPYEYKDVAPLRLALSSLRTKFMEILMSEGVEGMELKEVRIRYEFPPDGDDYTANCLMSVKTADGSLIESAVDSGGNTAEIIKQTTEQFGGHNSGGCAPSA